MLGMQLACRLNMDTRVDALQDDLKIAERFDFKQHPLNYHDGTWTAINLVYAGGETHYAHKGPDGNGYRRAAADRSPQEVPLLH
jgi:hypothetical protein